LIVSERETRSEERLGEKERWGREGREREREGKRERV
jgi:hypothetical protein